jgi:hypothetical protein
LLRDAPVGLTFKILHSAHTVFMCFEFISKQTATFALYNKKLIVFYNRDEKCLQRGTNWVFKTDYA